MKNNVKYIVVLIVIFGVLWLFNIPNQSRLNNGKSNSDVSKEKVVINEAVRTLLYLPLYHAESKGFFEELDLDLTIITAGSATAAFASMLSGESDFAQADPMYVPISREKGSDAIVVAQVIARISLWGVASSNFIGYFTAENIKGLTIASHPRPMTGYTYAVKAIKELGLEPNKDVELLEVRPGGELAALFSGEADIAFTLEPGTSLAEKQGARVILSFPETLGDQIFTALMTSESILKKRPMVVKKVASAMQKSLVDIYQNPFSATETAKKYFPELDENMLKTVVNRLINEKVYPTTIKTPLNSWEKAMSERIAIGDLKEKYPYNEAHASSVIDAVITRSP